MKFINYIASVLLLANLQVAYAEYTVDNSTATVGFSGEHAGMKFSGKFEQWTARISLPFDASDNTQSFINATFGVGSAKTGDFVYDETLPEGDWFDAESHPEGTFKSTSIVKLEQGFEVNGNLTLRGQTHPVKFTLNEKDGRLSASFNINRLAYGIGLDSDPEAEWVSKNIKMSINIPTN